MKIGTNRKVGIVMIIIGIIGVIGGMALAAQSSRIEVKASAENILEQLSRSGFVGTLSDIFFIIGFVATLLGIFFYYTGTPKKGRE